MGGWGMWDRGGGVVLRGKTRKGGCGQVYMML